MLFVLSQSPYLIPYPQRFRFFYCKFDVINFSGPQNHKGFTVHFEKFETWIQF